MMKKRPRGIWWRLQLSQCCALPRHLEESPRTAWHIVKVVGRCEGETEMSSRYKYTGRRVFTSAIMRQHSVSQRRSWRTFTSFAFHRTPITGTGVFRNVPMSRTKWDYIKISKRQFLLWQTQQLNLDAVLGWLWLSEFSSSCRKIS